MLRQICKILDEFFYRRFGGNFGRVRRWRIVYWLDGQEYYITHRISRWFHLRHCEECRNKNKESGK